MFFNLAIPHALSIVTKVPRTSNHQVLHSSNPHGVLLVLSPNHGKRVSYKWEKRNAKSTVWESIQVPAYTCLLYVDDPGDYSCTVDEETSILQCCAYNIYIYIYIPKFMCSVLLTLATA